MAQIRSKQIADFLASVNWTNVSANDIANAADIKSYVDGEISKEHAHHTDEKTELDASIDSLEVKAGADSDSLEERLSIEEDALAAEIAATTSDVASIDLRVSNEISATGSEVTSLDVRVAADIAALSSEISDTDVDFGSIDTRVSDVEDALTAEIAATNGDVNLINASIDSLEGVDAELSAEFSGNLAGEAATRLAADTALAASVDSLENKAGDDLAELNSSVDSLENVDAALSAEIVTEKGRIDAILNGSDVDLDQFAEVVAYVDSLDLADDNFLANEIASMNLRDTQLEASVDSLEGTQGSQDTRMTGIEGDLTAEISATDSEVLSLNLRISQEESLAIAEFGSVDTRFGSADVRMGTIESNLTAEIAATDAEVIDINASIDSLEVKAGADLAEINASVDSLENVDAALSAEIVVEKNRIDAILDGSTVDLDQFAEVVAYVDSLDLADDNFLANEIASMNLRDTNLEGSVDSLEVALQAEIDATDSEVIRLDGRVDSLETKHDAEMSVETAARVLGDTYVEAAVTGVDATAGSVAVNVPTHSFEMGAFDTEVYVNGLRVAFTQDGAQDFTLSVNYPIEATDIIRFVGVGAEVVA